MYCFAPAAPWLARTTCKVKRIRALRKPKPTFWAVLPEAAHAVQTLPADRSYFYAAFIRLPAHPSRISTSPRPFWPSRHVKGTVMVSFAALPAFVTAFAAKPVSFCKYAASTDSRMALSLPAVETGNRRAAKSGSSIGRGRERVRDMVPVRQSDGMRQLRWDERDGTR
jgi:hypothetical protein